MSGKNLFISMAVLVVLAAAAAAVMTNLRASATLQMMQRQMGHVEGRLQELEGRQGLMGGPAREGRRPPSDQTMALLAGAIQQIQETLKAAGIQQLASNSVDPAVLQNIVGDYAQKAQITAQREKLVQRNREMHEADKARYGEAIGPLFQMARGSMSRDPNSKDAKASDTAFMTLLQNYPEANSTGMAIAERALQSGLTMKTSEVEYYYNLLNSKGNFASVVTDSGVEANPTLQSFLAQQYLREGRTDEAQSLLDNLEKNYSSSLVPVPGQNGGMDWKQVGDLTKDIKNRVATGGGQPPPGGGPPSQPAGLEK